MDLFVRVISGNIIGSPVKLPASWQGISGFDTLKSSPQGLNRLKRMGWLPVVEINGDYDPEKYKREIFTCNIGENEVIYTYKLLALDDINYRKKQKPKPSGRKTVTIENLLEQMQALESRVAVLEDIEL